MRPYAPPAAQANPVAPLHPAAPPPPPGTFLPGTRIMVGKHQVVIQKYLSEGGFAHVYLVKMPKPVNGTDLAVLKRVAVPDKETLRHMRSEVETMKRLQGHHHIVTYIDSHASELSGGGYEVFLLMEYCDGGGLIDFMNARLQHRLTEPEILDIFADVAEGVACMHYLKPPLLHRDLKVENVLITSRASAERYKLCDFGSAAPIRPAPSSVVECRLIDEDVQKHTTLQYRSPEMVDVYRRLPLDEKCDIWALGVLLYKLCYYTTPFENQGQLAILNASFKYPAYPTYSDRIKRLIASMLRESPQQRPTIYTVLKEVCTMQGRQVPLSDIYSSSASNQSEPRDPISPSADKTIDKATARNFGAVYSSAKSNKTEAVPVVTPMRRGRPTPSLVTTAGNPSAPANLSSQKINKGDPFASLDRPATQQAFNPDLLSDRFPTLDQFALLHSKGTNFNFDPPAKAPSDHGVRLEVDTTHAARASAPPGNNLKIVQALSRSSSATRSIHRPSASEKLKGTDRSVSAAPLRRQSIDSNKAQAILNNHPELKAIASPPPIEYVSTGTMTVDTTSEVSQRPHRHHRDSSPPHNEYASSPRRSMQRTRPLFQDPRAAEARLRISESSAGSAPRPRPASIVGEGSTLDFLREKKLLHQRSKHALTGARDSLHEPLASLNALKHLSFIHGSDTKHHSSQQKKDVQKRHSQELARPTEDAASQSSAVKQDLQTPPRIQSEPVLDTQVRTWDPYSSSRSEAPTKPTLASRLKQLPNRSESSIEAVGSSLESSESRREEERRRLDEEDRRVALAQADHKRRLGSVAQTLKPVPGPKKVGAAVLKATGIHSRVGSLLHKEQQPAPVARTAKGYGKYVDGAETQGREPKKEPPAVPRKMAGKPVHVPQDPEPTEAKPAPRKELETTSPAGPQLPREKLGSSVKPATPHKPVHLNKKSSSATPPLSPGASNSSNRSQSLPAKDPAGETVFELSPRAKHDSIEAFTRRYPSLSAIEIGVARGGGSRGGKDGGNNGSMTQH